MAYPGWITIGTQDPVGHPGDFTEIVNNPRAYTYAEQAGICWLQDCLGCENTHTILPGYPYTSPALDPAPWYDAANPDSEGFLGVVGLDITGEENSTRQASVSMSMSGSGVIGPTYLGPRTMVIRALAVAADDCSLQYGLTWLRQQYAAQHNPCGGDTMTFFDCCPCVCDDPGGNPDCWAANYNELQTGPPCLVELADPWWPDTYDQLVSGPPTDEVWCNWVDIYRDLSTGGPDWACCINDCVVPYLRQFYNVRVTEGPTVLSNPVMHSTGAVAEIEFTIVAADPRVYGDVQRNATRIIDGGVPIVDVAPPAPHVNPYRPTPAPPVFVPEKWVRESFDVPRLKEQILTGIEPRVRVRASRRTGPVRLGLWAGDTRVAGYTIPFVAQNSSVIVNGSDAYYSVPDGYERLSAFVKDWDGKWPSPLDLPHGEYRLTIDQHPDDAVKLFVDVSLAPVGAG